MSTVEAGDPVADPEVERRSDGVYFPAMDGYRAFAALSVLLAHVALLSGIVRTNTALGPYLARADVGVSVFFLLSGFLLYRPFVAAHLAGRSAGSLGGYARRRALRILPAYWFALTIVAFVLRAPSFEAPHNIVAHYLLLHPYDIDQVTGGPIQQSWTLATEVGFYVFLPVWAWLVGRGGGWVSRGIRTPERQIRVEAVALVALWAAAIAVKLIVVAQHPSEERFGLWGAWLPFRLDEFALGMGLAVASEWVAHRGVRLPAWTRRTWATLGCWAVAAVLFWVTSTQIGLDPVPIFTPRQALVTRMLYAFIALFLLLPAVLGRSEGGPVAALFRNRVMIWLGLTSYGIYIWHEAWQDKYLGWVGDPMFRSPFWPMLGVTVVLTLVSAAVSWYLVERPALLLKGRR
jgi:peptidoglycan/LPS O-acetylase OafA/YrhL